VRTANVLIALLTLSCSAFGQDLVDPNRQEVEGWAFTSYENVEKFVMDFREAVRERSCFKVAGLTNFPLRVNLSNRRTRFLYNRAALCRYFAQIFDEATTHAVLNTPLSPVGHRGLMFGSGGIWIVPVCVDKATADCKSRLGLTIANIGSEAALRPAPANEVKVP